MSRKRSPEYWKDHNKGDFIRSFLIKYGTKEQPPNNYYAPIKYNYQVDFGEGEMHIFYTDSNYAWEKSGIMIKDVNGNEHILMLRKRRKLTFTINHHKNRKIIKKLYDYLVLFEPEFQP